MNVLIFNCRPHLEHAITGIVASIHSGDGLPETLFAEQQSLASAPFHERMKIALSRVFETYDVEEMFEYAVEETAKVAALGDVESAGTSLTGALSLDDGGLPSFYCTTDPIIEKAPVPPNLSEVPEGQVSLKGLDAMIVKFLGGIGEYSNSEMVELFQKIDTDGSGFVDRIEFDEFVKLATRDEFMRGRTAWVQQAKAMAKMENKSKAKMSSLSLIHRSSMRLSAGTSEPMMKTITEHSSFGSSSHHLAQTGKFKSVLGDEGTIDYVKTIADSTNGSKNPLEDWTVFYCGGSNKIKANLKEIARKYGINFAVEKFDW